MRIGRNLGRQETAGRLMHYLENTKGVDWGASGKTALGTVFNELAQLAYDDVRYYDKARKRHRRLSQFTRFVAWACGTAGLLAPPLAAIRPEFKDLAAYAYPALVVGGATLVFNRLFGSTKGHVRYVTAQLALEHRITRFHLQWSQWLAKHPEESLAQAQVDEVFQLFSDFAGDTYKIVQQETTAWGLAVIADMEEVGKQLPKADNPGAGAPQANPRPADPKADRQG